MAGGWARMTRFACRGGALKGFTVSARSPKTVGAAFSFHLWHQTGLQWAPDLDRPPTWQRDHTSHGWPGTRSFLHQALLRYDCGSGYGFQFLLHARTGNDAL